MAQSSSNTIHWINRTATCPHNRLYIVQEALPDDGLKEHVSDRESWIKVSFLTGKSSSYSRSRRGPLHRFTTMTTSYGMPPEFHWWCFRVPPNWIDPTSVGSTRTSFPIATRRTTDRQINMQLINVNCSVPQGSVFGPVQFITYTKDVIIAVFKKHGVGHHLYADDK